MLYVLETIFWMYTYRATPSGTSPVTLTVLVADHGYDMCGPTYGN